MNTLGDLSNQIRTFRHRVLAIGLLLVMLLSVLIYRYYSLQIIQHQTYATKSDANRIHIQVVPPTRGLIYDRNNVVLAQNLPSYTLSIIPKETNDIDGLVADLDKLLQLTPSEKERFITARAEYRRTHSSIPLRLHLTEEDVAILAVNQFALPGAAVSVELVRNYPFKEVFSHSIGYVGRINAKEVKQIDRDAYIGTHVIGKTGIEKQYESILLGKISNQQVETDARGRVLRVLEKSELEFGANITLSIDAELQKAAYDLLKGKRASVVAIDIATGEILTLLSMPSYDPNMFVTGISHANFNGLLADKGKPLFDRSLTGQYPPGSILKPIYALAGLQEKTVTPELTIEDKGKFQLQGEERVYRDWKKEGHGEVNIYSAIEQSCDVYFYKLGEATGVDKLSKYADYFGIGTATGVDMPSERSGILPSRAWKVSSKGIAWYPGDTINMSIGQGFTLATPIQLAQMTAVLARKGQWITPTMLKSIQNMDLEENRTMLDRHQPEMQIDNKNYELVADAMESVVHGLRGTAKTQGRNLTYQMAGKTGTAQVVGIAQDMEYESEALSEKYRDHALFVSYAPVQNPAIAIAVLVENGEHGNTAAAPIAIALSNLWFEKHPELLSSWVGRHVDLNGATSKISVGGQ